MNILYDSFTGKVKKFVSKLPKEYNIRHISEYDGNSLYYIVVPTTGFGELLKTTTEFINKHGDKCLGVGASGNRIWGANYGVAADIISKKCKVPIISKFENDGKEEEVEFFIERLEQLEIERNKE